METKVGRRSFLALIAAALTVKPEALTLKAGDHIKIDIAANPIIPNWWRQWSVVDTVIINPNADTSETLFSSPIPSGFEIHSMAWLTDPQTTLDDLELLLSLEYRIRCDGNVICAGPMPLFGGINAFLFGGLLGGQDKSRRSFWPTLAPREDFRIDIAGGAIPISAARNIHFRLAGQILNV